MTATRSDIHILKIPISHKYRKVSQLPCTPMEAPCHAYVGVAFYGLTPFFPHEIDYDFMNLENIHQYIHP